MRLIEPIQMEEPNISRLYPRPFAVFSRTEGTLEGRVRVESCGEGRAQFYFSLLSIGGEELEGFDLTVTGLDGEDLLPTRHCEGFLYYEQGPDGDGVPFEGGRIVLERTGEGCVTLELEVLEPEAAIPEIDVSSGRHKRFAAVARGLATENTSVFDCLPQAPRNWVDLDPRLRLFGGAGVRVLERSAEAKEQIAVGKGILGPDSIPETERIEFPAELFRDLRKPGEVGAVARERFYQRVMHFSVRVVTSCFGCVDLDAEDIATEVAAKLAGGKIEKFRPNQDGDDVGRQFESWLYTVVKNHWLDRTKSWKRRGGGQHLSLEGNFGQADGDGENRDWLDKLLLESRSTGEGRFGGNVIVSLEELFKARGWTNRLWQLELLRMNSIEGLTIEEIAWDEECRARLGKRAGVHPGSLRRYLRSIRKFIRPLLAGEDL